VLKDAGSGKHLERDAEKRVNTLQRRGYFAGQDISDAVRQYLLPSELRAFFKALPETSLWYAYFYIQYRFGCSLSEPALILDEDIHAECDKKCRGCGQKKVIIRRLKKAHVDRGFDEYVYALDPRVLKCVRVVQAWKRQQGIEGNPFLFASQRRRTEEQIGAERLSQLRNLDGWQAISRFTAHRVFQGVAKSVKILDHLCQSQTLRHTRAAVLLACGVLPDQVQYLLGHNSMKMTQRYQGVAAGLQGKMDALTAMGLGAP
jgi:integrase